MFKLLFQTWWLFSYVYPNEFWFNYVFGDKWDSFGMMIADGWVMLNYINYLFFYELYRRLVFLVGFEILALFCSAFFYPLVWSYVFNHQAWELQAEFQNILDNQDKTLYGDKVPYNVYSELGFWPVIVYHYIGMNNAGFISFFRIFLQNIVDTWAGTIGFVLLGIPIGFVLIGQSSTAYETVSTIHRLLYLYRY